MYGSDHTILFKFHQHACGLNTYQIMYGEALDFQYQDQQWLHKMSDRLINFCS